MPLLNVILTLALVGLVLWAVNTYIPMAAAIKKILNIVVIIFVLIWLLQAFGVLSKITI